MLRTEDYAYPLPDELIARHPAARREDSRLLLLDRTSGRIEHRQFAELPDDVCWKADVDEAEVPQLVAYLECMIRRPEVRRQLLH